MSYRGLIVPLPVGQQGFTGTENPSQAGPGHLTFTDGVELDAGVLKKEGGASKFNQQPLNSTPDADTALLLHGNGLDTSITITDSSTFVHTCTAVANAQIDTDQSVFGGASILFDGTGDRVDVADHAIFDMGSGPFTIEGRIRPAVDNTTIGIGAHRSALVAASSAWFLRRDSDNRITGGVSDGSTFIFVTSISTVLAGSFAHVALIRSGNQIMIAVNGSIESVASFTGAVPSITGVLYVGQAGFPALGVDHPMNGHIDEFRISKVARWTSQFTPPTAEYPNSQPGGGSTVGDVIISGTNWSPLDALRRDYVFIGSGKVLKDTGGGTFATTMVSGLTSTRDPPPWFAPGGGEATGASRKLFMFSRTNQVQVVAADGNTMANIVTPAADWTGAGNFPTFGLMHAGRMWAGGNASDPHRIYYSMLTNHETFVDASAGTVAVFPGEGERIVGAFSFRGALIIFKYPTGIYALNTSDPSPANWILAPITRAIGTLNQHTLVQIENDLLFLDVTGDVHAMSVVQEFGDFTTSDIGDGEKIHAFMKTGVNTTKLRRAQGIWYGRKQQAWWALPMLGSDDNNLRLIASIEAGAQQNQVVRRFFMSRRDTCVAMWMKPDDLSSIPYPAVGDASGSIWLMDRDSRDKDGSGYPFSFETANTDLSFFEQQLANRSKNGQFLEIAYEPKGDWNLTVEAFWDDVLTDTLLFNMGSGGAALGSFILDADALGGGTVRNQRIKMDGSGRRLKLAAMNDGAGEDISISAFYVHVGVADERIE